MPDAVNLVRSATDEQHPSYSLASEYGTLTFDSYRVELSADGDLPPWSVASDYATDCDVALADGGEDALWQCLEEHYVRMLPQLNESITGSSPSAVDRG